MFITVILKRATYVAEQPVEGEIGAAGCENHLVEELGHHGEVDAHEGCDYCGCAEQNLPQSLGVIPESCLNHLSCSLSDGLAVSLIWSETSLSP